MEEKVDRFDFVQMDVDAAFNEWNVIGERVYWQWSQLSLPTGLPSVVRPTTSTRV